MIEMASSETVADQGPEPQFGKFSYLVNLDFEEIKLPPVSDILVLGKKSKQGKHGILHSFNVILPDLFEMREIDDEKFPEIDAVIINKDILRKLPFDEIVRILRRNVFPHVAIGETVNVNFSVHIFQRQISGVVSGNS